MIRSKSKIPKKGRKSGRLSDLHVAAFALGIVIACLAGLEAFARLPAIQGYLDFRSFGFQNYPFELKWFKLQTLMQQNGGIDILFVGNSLVNVGIDPETFNHSFESESDVSLRSFNFGLDGLNLTATDEVVRLLVETHHVDVVVFGTEIRDYAFSGDTSYSSEFLRTPWLVYRSGSFSLYGWLVDHSEFLKDYLLFRNWYQADFVKQFKYKKARWEKMTPFGYEVEGNSVNWRIPQPNFWDPIEMQRKQVFRSFQFSEERFQILTDLIQYCTDNGVAIVVLAMPVTDAFYEYFPEPQAIRAEFLERLAETAENSGAIFLAAPASLSDPSLGWANLNHLNSDGAKVFSQYLGENLADMDEVRNAIIGVGREP
jgi:hypothetical protein